MNYVFNIYWIICNCISLRLNKDQKESTKKELEASADAIKLKHGLEKALKAFTKDPENAIPEEFS